MIFLDLNKAYDALYRSRFLEILEGYSVVLRSRRLLQKYWRRLTMVARAGGYYRIALKQELRVTQGNPLSPNIFNVVVGAVVRHWVAEVIADTEERGKPGKEGRHQAELFYADNGMVDSSDPAGYRVLSIPWLSCTPPPTDSLPPGRGGRPFRLSS